MGVTNSLDSRLIAAASLAFLGACGARSELETSAPAATTSSGEHGCEVEAVEVPGCVLQATQVNGAGAAAHPRRSPWRTHGARPPDARRRAK